jgi:hypothetical protein
MGENAPMVRGIFFAAVLFAAVPAPAQQSVPKTSGDPLQDICTGFMEQSGQGVSGDRNKLCTCLVRETKSRLTPQEMKAYSEAGQAGRAPPDAIMQKVMGIATACLTESAGR